MPPTSKSEQKISILKQYDGNGNPFLDQYLHPLVSKIEQGNYYTTPRNGDICCWYCGYEIQGLAYPLPKQYWAEECKFRVWGAFCTLNCVKGQIMFGPANGNAQEQLGLLTMMGSIIYKVNIISLVAYDKYLFEKYGGKILHSWYMENWDKLPKIFLRDEPPFIPTYALVEIGIKNTSGLNLSDLDQRNSRRQHVQQQEKQSLQEIQQLLQGNQLKNNGQSNEHINTQLLQTSQQEQLLQTSQQEQLLQTSQQQEEELKRPNRSLTNTTSKYPPEYLTKEEKANWYRNQAELKKKENGYVEGGKKNKTRNKTNNEPFNNNNNNNNNTNNNNQINSNINNNLFNSQVNDMKHQDQLIQDQNNINLRRSGRSPLRHHLVDTVNNSQYIDNSQGINSQSMDNSQGINSQGINNSLSINNSQGTDNSSSINNSQYIDNNQYIEEDEDTVVINSMKKSNRGRKKAGIPKQQPTRMHTNTLMDMMNISQ